MADNLLYDVLEVSANASLEEIETSYLRILEELGTQSLAMYSMFDEHQVEQLRARIEEAYLTLSDADRRQAYDLSRTLSAKATGDSRNENYRDQAALSDDRVEIGDLIQHPVAEVTAHLMDDVAEGAVRIPSSSPSPSGAGVRSVSGKRKRLSTVALPNITPETEFSGALLRQLRESCEMSLDELSDATKINKRYLHAVEENDFETLPAPVYVRGFVSEYARALGLDPKAVRDSYMVLYKRYRGSGS